MDTIEYVHLYFNNLFFFVLKGIQMKVLLGKRWSTLPVKSLSKEDLRIFQGWQIFRPMTKVTWITEVYEIGLLQQNRGSNGIIYIWSASCSAAQYCDMIMSVTLFPLLFVSDLHTYRLTARVDKCKLVLISCPFRRFALVVTSVLCVICMFWKHYRFTKLLFFFFHTGH